VAVGAGLLAAWGAARYAWCLTAVALVVLIATLALPPAERRLISVGWAGVGVVVLALAWVVALDHELALRHTLTFVLAAALFGLSRRAGPSDRLLGALALGLAATVAVAAFQLVGRTTVDPAALAGIAPELRTFVVERLAKGRASGTTSLPGHFAVLLVMASPLLWQRLASARGWRRAPWLAGLFAAAAGVVMSRSVAGVGVAVAVLALLVALRPPRWQVLAPALVVLLGIGAVIVLRRPDAVRLEPLHLRWINWQTTAWVAAHYPVLGVGLGGVGQAGLVAPAGAANITPYAHNSFLQLAAELGLAGAGLVVAGVWALVRLLAAGARDQMALALAVAVLPLHNLVDFSFYAPEVLLPWAVLAGALAARVGRAPRGSLSAWLLLPALGGAVVVSAADWRSEVLLSEAYATPPWQAVALAQQAATWAPWAATPLLAAASSALEARDPRMAPVESALARRAWVCPVSSAWAEMRARLLLASGRRGEALVWAREARRRAPWQGRLEVLEAECRAGS
jgi:putative inorganic carbon (hco3(-)) transporter